MQYRTGPTDSSAIAQSAKQRIADCRGQKNSGQGQPGRPGREPVSALEKKRAQTAHSPAGKVAQAEGHTARDEEKPERRSREQFLRGSCVCNHSVWRGTFF